MMKSVRWRHISKHCYAIFAAVVIFWGYVQTLAPTVSFFDSGELIGAAYSLGVAHPPGYPLYVLCGWLFAHLPIGDGAYRLNLMSAVFATLAAVTVFYLTHLLIASRMQDDGRQPEEAVVAERLLYPVISFVAALLFAFSSRHWSHAVIAEVYSLNAFMCGLILWLLLTWRARRQDENTPALQHIDSSAWRFHAAENVRLLLAAFCFGLGFGNHQTIALLAFAAVFLTLKTTPNILRSRKKLVLLGVALLLGFSIYALVPIRAAQNPAVNWGNASTLRQFTWLITREGYKDVLQGKAFSTLRHALFNKHVTEEEAMPGSSPEPQRRLRGIARVAHIVRHSLLVRQLQTFTPLREFGALGLTLALLGALYGMWMRPVSTLTLLIASASLVLITVFISDPPAENVFLVEEFHTPSYLIVAVLIGLGLMALARGALWVASPVEPDNGAASWSRARIVVVFLLTLSFLLLSGGRMAQNFPQVDRSRNYVAYDYASNVLTSLKPNAILFTWGDSGAFPLWYLQIVEQRRADVLLIHVPHLSSGWYVDALPPELFFTENPLNAAQGDILKLVHEIVQTQRLARPIYFDFSSAHSIMPPYPLLPTGIVYKVAVPGDTVDGAVWSRYRLRGVLDRRRIALDADIQRTFVIYGTAHMELGNYYLEVDDVEQAAEEFNLAVKFAPELGEGIVQELNFRNKLVSE